MIFIRIIRKRKKITSSSSHLVATILGFPTDGTKREVHSFGCFLSNVFRNMGGGHEGPPTL